MKIADKEFCEVEKDPTSNIKWEILRMRVPDALPLHDALPISRDTTCGKIFKVRRIGTSSIRPDKRVR